MREPLEEEQQRQRPQVPVRARLPERQLQQELPRQSAALEAESQQRQRMPTCAPWAPLLSSFLPWAREARRIRHSQPLRAAWWQKAQPLRLVRSSRREPASRWRPRVRQRVPIPALRLRIGLSCFPDRLPKFPHSPARGGRDWKDIAASFCADGG